MAFVCIYDKQKLFLCSILSAFWHELGHIVAMYMVGMQVNKISLRAFGVDMVIKEKHLSKSKQVVVLISGAFFNILAILFFCLLLKSKACNIFNHLILCNFVLAIFNLLPIPVLDGGQVAYVLLSGVASDILARKIVDIISYIILSILFFIGVLLIIKCRYNFSLLLTSIYLLLVMLTKQDRYIAIGDK